jgi:lipid-A-disaccharide synthase-like uncharacterized protein
MFFFNLALILGSMFQNWHLPDTPGKWFWEIFGLTGNFVFASRFFIQWIHSERHGESRIPDSFWWQSALGVLILFVYFFHQGSMVGMLGNGPQLVPYIRNIMLIQNKKKRETENGFPIEPKK